MLRKRFLYSKAKSWLAVFLITVFGTALFGRSVSYLSINQNETLLNYVANGCSYTLTPYEACTHPNSENESYVRKRFGDQARVGFNSRSLSYTLTYLAKNEIENGNLYLSGDTYMLLTNFEKEHLSVTSQYLPDLVFPANLVIDSSIPYKEVWFSSRILEYSLPEEITFLVSRSKNGETKDLRECRFISESSFKEQHPDFSNQLNPNEVYSSDIGSGISFAFHKPRVSSLPSYLLKKAPDLSDVFPDDFTINHLDGSFSLSKDTFVFRDDDVHLLATHLDWLSQWVVEASESSVDVLRSLAVSKKFLISSLDDKKSSLDWYLNSSVVDFQNRSFAYLSGFLTLFLLFGITITILRKEEPKIVQSFVRSGDKDQALKWLLLVLGTGSAAGWEIGAAILPLIIKGTCFYDIGISKAFFVYDYQTIYLRVLFLFGLMIIVLLTTTLLTLRRKKLIQKAREISA